MTKLARFSFYQLIFLMGIFGCLSFSYLLRFDFDVAMIDEHNSFLRVLLPAIPIKLVIYWKFSLAAGWWRYASLADVVRILGQATIVSSLALALFLFVANGFIGIPRSVLMLDCMATFLFLCGIGLITRLIRENYLTNIHSRLGRRTLILGAGEAGQSIVREIRKNNDLAVQIVGFLDDDPLKKNMILQGISVLASIDSVANIVLEREVDDIIIAIPGASSREMRRIIDFCTPTQKNITTLPGISDLIDGKVSVEQVRAVDVQDLLGRREIELDVEKLSDFIAGKTILVTGAAGSIGSELARQVSRYSPDKLILFDAAESPLFFVDRELSVFASEIIPVVGNVRNRVSVRSMFAKYRPEIVFHAAAYKHVPLMEDHPDAAVSVNVLGTKVVADAADEYGVSSFVMVSTDKAVNPTNVMGATKRCAEMYIQGLGKNSSTCFITVRFGNVLGSAGSVIPIFRQQIASGGPVTVTHPEVTRYFMTIPEAAQLVLQASCIGGRSEIYMLDMGEPVKIQYLAEEMIRLSGFVPYEDIDIEFTGLRPGEKLFEELLLSDEGVLPTEHESIRISRTSNIVVVDFENHFEDLIKMDAGRSRDEFIEKLLRVVPEYSPATNEMNKIAGYEANPI